MKTKKDTLKELYIKHFGQFVEKEESVKDIPSFIVYFFNMLYTKYGNGKISAHTLGEGIERTIVSFLVKKEHGGGWFTCSCESLLGHAYDIFYGQDKERQKPLLTIRAGYYSDGVRQSFAIPGSNPDLQIVSKSLHTFLLTGIDQALPGEKMKYFIFTDLCLFESLFKKVPVPASEFSEQ